MKQHNMRFFSLFFFLVTFSTFSQNKIINKIEFSGTKIMNVKFLEKLILSKQGAVLDSISLKKDIQILNRMNGISKSEFQILFLENDQVKIRYIIVENYSLIPSFNATTTNDLGSYRFGLYEFNFLGKNNSLGGFYQYNGFNSFGISFLSPHFFSSKFGIGSSVQKLTSKEPVFFNNSSANYIYTNSSIEISSNYNIDSKNEIKLGLTFFNEKYKYADGATANDIPIDLNLNKKQLKLQYSFDNLNYDYYLVRGFKSNLQLQYVITENNFENKFLIGWNDFMYFKNIGSKGNFASRLRIGFSDNVNSPFSPFSVDNNLNIRGVGNIIDRGTGTIVLNTEFRKTLFEKKWFVLQGNAFVDSGTWRNPGGNFDDFTNQKNIRVYSGLGIRLIHKTIFNAIFRLDYGVGLTKNASKGFVFGIGQYF